MGPVVDCRLRLVGPGWPAAASSAPGPATIGLYHLPTTQPPPPASPPASTEPLLTGFGGTRASWDASHQEAGGRFTRGSVYGPLLAGAQPTYAGVVGDDRIISYDLYMAPGIVGARAMTPAHAAAGDGPDGRRWRPPPPDRDSCG